MLSTIPMMASPGNVASHQPLIRYSLPSASAIPQLGVGGGTPSPRKQRAGGAQLEPAATNEPKLTPAFWLAAPAQASTPTSTASVTLEAAAIAILLHAGLIASIVIKDKSAGSYVIASAPSTDPGVGAFTLIRFAPQATSDDITKFFEANKLQVAAGPMAGGFYKVRVAVTGLPKAELARIVKKLQEDKVVGFIATTE